MVRALLATLAALLLVGVLSLLIIESRAVKEDYYVAHAERMRAIEASGNDIDAIIQGAEAAFDEGRAVPSSVDLAFARLAENSALLQIPMTPAAADSNVPTQIIAYDDQLKQLIANGQAFALRQNTLAEALRLLQEESPAVVKDLRRFNLRIESQNAFSLAIDVMELAMGRNQTDPERLVARIETLRSDGTVQSEAPGRLDTFLTAASTIIGEHTAAKTALGEIGTSRVADELSLLSAELLNDNRRIVSRAERARLLLAVCAVLLLIGAGFAMLRLQSSYRDLNRSNTELAKVNDSLEQRVSARTEELSGAYEELKESQVQLVQAEKMSSLGELVAGISHEINTPLWYLMSNSTVVQERLVEIGNFLEIAENMITAAKSRTAVKEAVSVGLVGMNKMIAAGLKEDIDEAVDLVRDSIEGLEELSELAQSLKDFSRLDRAKQGQFNVNEGLTKTLLIVKNKIKYNATVHKHFGEVPSILCSPSQINQVFLNLIVNAADSLDEQGDIVLHTWVKDGTVGIRVADTGCGIPEDELSKVRDPFFTTKDVGKGTGLGLSIVDQIVTAHHGKLTIESTPGEGTTVTVLLPVEPPAEEIAAEAVETSSASTATVQARAAEAKVADPEIAEPEVARPEAAERDVARPEVAEPEVAEASDEADWAGDTNVQAADGDDDNAESQASEAASAGDSESDAEASPDKATAEEDADDQDWAGDTSVTNSDAFTDEAQNDEDATDPSAVADEAETDIANIDASDTETDIADLDAADENVDVDPDAAPTVTDWNVDTHIVQLLSDPEGSDEEGLPVLCEQATPVNSDTTAREQDEPPAKSDS